jgi:hypothetical protein
MDHTSLYTAWYNQGANEPATNDGNHPWLVPPTTRSSLQGPTYMAGGVTYVAGTTLVGLDASQSTAASRFGKMMTYYRVFQAGNPLPPFFPYTGPFAVADSSGLAPVDGAFVVQDYSVDGLGNCEATHTLNLTLDTTPPAVTIVQPAATSYPHSSTLVLDYSASDGGSGLQSVTPKLDGATTLDGHGLASGQGIDLLTELKVGIHDFTIVATDNLGNTRSSSVEFEIIVTADSIRDDVRHFGLTGMIKNSGLADSLLAKLNAAAEAQLRGDCRTAASVYEAFINELLAQSGEGVDAGATKIMIADAQYLIGHCP